MKHHLQGLSLPTVVVMLALTSLAALLAWRNLWVNAQLLNAEADLLRTQHKAHAVLPVALADIVGNANSSDAAQDVNRNNASMPFSPIWPNLAKAAV